MKHLLFLFSLLVVATVSNAQLVGYRPKVITNHYRCDATISNDTLYITDESHLTTIKIGEKFYKIVKHETTIDAEQPVRLSPVYPFYQATPSTIYDRGFPLIIDTLNPR